MVHWKNEGGGSKVCFSEHNLWFKKRDFLVSKGLV